MNTMTEDYIIHQPKDIQDEISNRNWVKDKLKTLWTAPKFCGLCLEDQGNFTMLEMEMVISNQANSKCLQDIINYVFCEDIQNITSSSYLCDECTEKTIQSYLFIHNSKQLSKIISNCVSDIYSKAVDVNEGIDSSKNYENANVMIVLEDDINLYGTIDMRPVTEIMPIATPVIKPNLEASTDTPKPVEKSAIKIENWNISITNPVLHKQEPEKQVLAVENTKMIDITIEQERTFKAIKPKPQIKATEQNCELKQKEEALEPTAPNISSKGGLIVVKPLSSFKSSTVVPKYNVYKCNSCPEILFTSYRSLKEHEKAKHKPCVYSCKLCNKVYNTAQYLQIHYKTHNKSTCKLCKLIVSDDELMDHLRKTHTNNVFPCQFCDLVYYTQEAVEIHFKISHLVNVTKQKSQCLMCLKNFVDSDIKKHKCKFSCSECFVAPCIHYKYLMSYREQIMNHANVVKCITCDYVTKRKEHLIAHANREHLDHHPFTCADCGQQFYTKISLKSHLVQFHQDLNCQYCDFDFKDHNTLETHRKACRNVARCYTCDLCVASFDTADELSNHMCLRHSEGVHACALCKCRFLTEIELKEHHAKAHGGIQVKKRRKHIECSLCNLMFGNVKELLAHEKLHNPGDIYPCKVCPKKYNSLMKLYMHNHRHYTDRVKCNGCNKKIATSFYQQHAVKCSSTRDAVLVNVCEMCGKAFYTESLLRVHLKSHVKSEPCPICNKCVKPSNMKKHMESTHTNNPYEIVEKRVGTKVAFECELCGHLMRKKSDLEAHMNRYHLKIKPYVCNICNKDFCGKARLKEHTATHSNDNSCFCPECGKRFANRVCLKMHYRIHTGETPYTCDICGQKFRSSSMMKTHRLKKHLEKTVGCPLCDSMFSIVRDMRHHFKKSHWKHKDVPFNPKLVKELSPKFYHLFEDGRLPKLTENS